MTPTADSPHSCSTNHRWPGCSSGICPTRTTGSGCVSSLECILHLHFTFGCTTRLRGMKDLQVKFLVQHFHLSGQTVSQ